VIEIGSPEKPKVLVVDDEVEVLNSLADLLRKDFHIFATPDIGEAQGLLASHQMFSVVISDQRMPLLTGAEFLATVANTCPDTARILLTGYADLEAVIEAVNRARIVRYITKPWDADKLLETLKAIAEQHQMLQENRRIIQKLAQLNESAENSSARVKSLEENQSTLQSDNQALKAAYDQLDKSFWHLRKIQEVLPICMNCGKVKTSDSSWEDVVSFLKGNSMFLSHGYCPECADKMMRRLKKRKPRGGLLRDNRG
jgi:response regulator RpfG family c-di-GMP phosphodiesterase